jgi:hypothetical protein
MIAQIGIRQCEGSGQFTLSQLSLICKEKAYTSNPFAGKGVNIYPLGYLTAADRVKIMNLTDKIILAPEDFVTPTRWLDFLFNVPEDLIPVLVQFKQNNIAQLPPPVAADQALLPQPFIPKADCATGTAKLEPAQSSILYGIELASGKNFLDGLTLEIKDLVQWKSSQTRSSIEPAKFEDGRILQARVELIVKEPNAAELKKIKEEAAEEERQARFAAKKKRQSFMPKKFVAAEMDSGIANMFKPLLGYTLLSLKCNAPATGAELKGEQLPVLMELSGLAHHPVGVIVGGKVDAQTVWEIDYCANPVSEDPNNPGCITIAKNGNVEKPFPENIWLTEKAKEITQFYALYLVKTAGNPIITSVKLTDANTPQKFDKFQAFSVK